MTLPHQTTYVDTPHDCLFIRLLSTYLLPEIYRIRVCHLFGSAKSGQVFIYANGHWMTRSQCFAAPRIQLLQFYQAGILVAVHIVISGAGL